MDDAAGRREWFILFGAAAFVLRYMREKNDTIVTLRVWHCKENRS